MATIFPSLISGDLLNLQKEISTLEPHVDGYHLDVMDNHFVPNLTWGPEFVNAIAKATDKRIWAHVMVDDPQEWIHTLKMPPESIFSFHYEAVGQNIHFIEHIKEMNWLASIAINPKTAVEKIFPLLDEIDQVLIMGVEPGFSGQDFIPSVVEKIEKLAIYRKTSGHSFTIGIDGGVNKKNITMLAEKGVDEITAASAVFGQGDKIAALKELYSLIS